MKIYTNTLSSENSTHEQREINWSILSSIVLENIVPRLNWGIKKYGIPIAGTYDQSPYTSEGIGRLRLLVYEDLDKVEMFLLLVMTQVKLTGMLDYFEIKRVLDGFQICFVW